MSNLLKHRRGSIVAFGLAIAACRPEPTPSDDAEPANVSDGGTGEVSPVAESCSNDQGRVKTALGCLAGERDHDVWAFRGIPFAAPPIGAMRWKAPVPASPWTGVRQAKQFSKACGQLLPTLSGDHLDWDEDCLYLNVWSRNLDEQTKQPVM